MSFLIGALKVIFVLGFLILIHEGGHFLVAKACKVKVKEFAIGFGPKVLERKKNETKYSLRLIPLGGYVDMLGEAERRDEEGSFSNSAIWKRFLIIIAGATVNIVFGLFVYFSLISIDFYEISTIVDSISEGYEQNLEGLENGDIIKSINGKKIHLKSDLDSYLATAKDENLILEIDRNNEIKEINVKATKVITNYIGIYFENSDDINSEIKYIQPNSPAEKAGLEVGDVILKIGDTYFNEISDISESITSENVNFVVSRNDKEETVIVEPEKIESYMLGVILKEADSTLKNRLYYGYWETVDYLKAIFENMVNIFKGNVNMNQMMGPIGISEIIVKTDGIHEIVYFLSIISLSLGVSNLLPIPALDGGRLLLIIIEAIRRKPLKEETEITIQMLGFSFLIILSLYISFNDIVRIF